MGFWSTLFDKGAKPSDPVQPQPQETVAAPAGGSEKNARIRAYHGAHHEVLEYVRALRAGAQPIPDYERRSLTTDLAFDTLALAELMVARAAAQGRGIKEVADRMRASGVVIPGAEEYEGSLSNLVERVGILADAFPNEGERRALLEGGAVGPGNEVLPFNPHVTVGFVVKYLRSLGL